MPSHYLFYVIKKACSCIRTSNLLLITLFLVNICGCKTDPKVTPEQFAHQAPLLYKNHEWRKCIKQGDKALATIQVQNKTSATQKQKINILVTQASPCFYLGRFKECYETAKKAYQVACSEADHEGIITSLYLQSAAMRALGKANEAIKLIIEAKEALKKAKTHLDPVKHRQLSAKVYFNSSAIYTDLLPHDLKQGRKDLDYALELFSKDPAQNERDIRRCERRISGIELRETNYLKAKSLATELITYYEKKSSNNKDHREYMLCLEILGNAKYHLGDKDSKAIMSQAINIANEFGAKGDTIRITKSLKEMESSKAK